MEEANFSDYLAGARNFYGYFGVEPGQHVLLLPTAEFLSKDPVSLHALAEVGKEIGAEVFVALIDACGRHGNPPRPLARAIESSDVFLAMGDKMANPITGHCLTALRARWDYGAKQADLHGGKGVLASDCSRFPRKITVAVARSLLAKLRNGKKIEIIDDRGTHLSLNYQKNDVYGTVLACETGHVRPGQRSTWPLGNYTVLPGNSFSGVAMADCVTGIPKILEKPVRFTFDNCRVVEVEDREETKRIRAELAKPENTTFIDKVITGINPKASIVKGAERSRFGELDEAAGVTRICIGDRPGLNIIAPFNANGTLLKPTIILDGEILFDHGRPTALDEPEVREVASKYGDPDQLLAILP